MLNEQTSLFNYSLTDSELRFKTLEEVKEVCKYCYKCKLSESRTQIVFSDGNSNAKIMLIGEGPGKNEDETGIPFVGKAGQLLDKILLSQNITREKDIYICNTVKCRPPENRVPLQDEMAACREYLDAQLQLVRPKIILLAGATAVKSMLDVNGKAGGANAHHNVLAGRSDDNMNATVSLAMSKPRNSFNMPISKIRGQWFDGPFESKIMPIFHPSYLLRNQSTVQGSPKWLMWQDIQEVRKVLDSL